MNIVQLSNLTAYIKNARINLSIVLYTAKSRENLLFFLEELCKPPDNLGGSNMRNENLFFNDPFNVFEKSLKCAHSDLTGRDKIKIPVKLVESSSEKIVELKLTEQENKSLADRYMSQLEEYAKVLERHYGAMWTVKDTNTIQIIFADGKIAKTIRETWKN